MKKNVFFSALAALTVLLALAACSMGLDPASNDATSKTSLQLKIGALLPPAESFAKDSPRVSGGRVVAPDYGYLYLRTIGGPTGSSGPFYGPFRIDTGKTFTTTAIPAGTYAGIGVLYATKPLDDLSIVVDGITLTFPQLMSLPDAAFIELTDDGEEEDGDKVLDLLIDGWASGEMVEGVTIASGKTNTLTVTLRPVTGDNEVRFWEGVNFYDKVGDPAVIERRFISLEGIIPTPGYAIESVSVSVHPEGAETYIGRCMLFTEAGVLVRDFGATGVITDVKTFEADYAIPYSAEGASFFLFVEYRTSMLSLTFGASEVLVEEPPVIPPVTPTYQNMTMTFMGNSAYASRRLFYSVYPAALVPNLDGDPTGAPVSAGMITLDSSGYCNSLAMVTGGTTAMDFANGTYYVSAFIDMDGTYSDIGSISDLPGGLQDIIPNRNDMMTTNRYTAVIFANAPSVFGLSPSALTAKVPYVYFVNQGGTGAGDRPDRSRSLSGLLSELGVTGPNQYEVYLTGAVDLFDQIRVNCASVDLRSHGTSAYGLGSSSTSGSPLYVSSGSSLSLRNISISTTMPRYEPWIDVYGELYIMVGTQILGAQNGEGSVIMINGTGSGEMSGGLIENCRGSQGVIGIVASGEDIPSFTMSGGTITNCVNNGYGTVYVRGDMAYYSSANFVMSGGTISNCSSSDNGGGVYIDIYGYMTLSGGTIQSCTTGVYGGGIFMSSDGHLILESGNVTLCSAGTGGGLYHNGSFLDTNGNASAIIHDNSPEDIYPEL